MGRGSNWSAKASSMPTTAWTANASVNAVNKGVADLNQ
jgi:hypothetical protein